MQQATEPAQIVGDRFRLERSIAVDVFGQVWIAVDQRSGASVRLRAIDPTWCIALGASTEVLALARGPSAVRHAHVAALVDVVVDNDRWYLASEPCEGESLAERVARTGPLDERAARCMASELAAALFKLHSMGAVHGRLDPTRVILGPFGAKLVDLGLGMLLGDDTEGWRTTIRDADDPAVAFLSPEQARGDGPPTRESDVWALAAILHFAVTGVSPYSAKTRAAQASAALSRTVTGPRGHARVASIIRAGLAAEPALRPSLPSFVERLRNRPTGRARAAAAAIAVVLVVGGLEASISPSTARAHRMEMTAPARTPEPTAASSTPLAAVTTEVSLVGSAVSTPKPRGPWRKPRPRDVFYGVTSAGF